jgi:hypothetical protein
MCIMCPRLGCRVAKQSQGGIDALKKFVCGEGACVRACGVECKFFFLILNLSRGSAWEGTRREPS